MPVPDVVCIFDDPLALRSTRKVYKGVLVHEIHSSLERALSRLRPSDLTVADLTIVPSRWSMDALAMRLTYSGNAIVVIPNFVDDVFLRAEHESKLTLSGRPSLFWVGKLVNTKNYSDGLRVAKMVKDHRPDIQLVFITGGQPADDEVRKFLTMAAIEGVEDNLIWLSNLSSAEIAGLYRRAVQNKAVAISTSKHESFGIAMLEAMACGLPVSFFSVDALNELFPPDLPALAYASGAVAEMAGAVVRLMDDDKFFEQQAEYSLISSARFAGVESVRKLVDALERQLAVKKVRRSVKPARKALSLAH